MAVKPTRIVIPTIAAPATRRARARAKPAFACPEALAWARDRGQRRPGRPSTHIAGMFLAATFGVTMRTTSLACLTLAMAGACILPACSNAAVDDDGPAAIESNL